MKSLVAALMLSTASFAFAEVTLVHVHGLSYSADGKRLMIPSHFGLAIYENGTWSKAPGPEHDYMGFSATSRSIYSSGHPAPNSGQVNPFGLLRSRDGGKTWDKLGLEGESDFHSMAAGWNNDAVYVWNTEPNSRMRARGLYYTLNDGDTWKRAGAVGLSGDLRGIAVHPDDAATLAMATSEGVYLSRDYGERFTQLARGPAFAPFFDLDGKGLWHAGFVDGKQILLRLGLGGRQQRGRELPPFHEDAVAYIAQNPVNRNEYAIATFQRDVYLSRDRGGSWTQIARRGSTN
jgi:hypothetical protein